MSTKLLIRDIYPLLKAMLPPSVGLHPRFQVRIVNRFTGPSGKWIETGMRDTARDLRDEQPLRVQWYTVTRRGALATLIETWDLVLAGRETEVPEIGWTKVSR